jgi:LmbE family N-acetylglucosaminyl deacetylase
VAEYLGIQYDIWDIDDCTLVADLDLRFRLIRYIRELSPDLIICHRTNDYHADHRAAGQLVQDASYILTVPHTCPDTPAMRFMPVIVHYDDNFKNPPFSPTYVMGIDEEYETKLHLMHLNASQVYEWLPYTWGQSVPEDEEGRRAFLKGTNITAETPDELIIALPTDADWSVRFAKAAAKYRHKLIEKYGEEEGRKIRFAEAFELSEYGAHPTPELEEALFNL